MGRKVQKTQQDEQINGDVMASAQPWPTRASVAATKQADGSIAIRVVDLYAARDAEGVRPAFARRLMSDALRETESLCFLQEGDQVRVEITRQAPRRKR